MHLQFHKLKHEYSGPSAHRTFGRMAKRLYEGKVPNNLCSLHAPAVMYDFRIVIPVYLLIICLIHDGLR